VSRSGVALVGFPEPADLLEYEEAGAALDQLLAELPGLVALYRFGGVEAPGISDIDRLAVVEDMTRVPTVWPRLSERVRHLAMHTPFIADVHTFRRHSWFAELARLELVQGKDVARDQCAFPDLAGQVIATEALVNIYLKLHKSGVTGRVKVRSLLCELNNIRHDLRLARLSPIEAAAAWLLADEVSDLRRAWWGLNRSEQSKRVGGVLERAPTALATALNAVDAQLAVGGFGKPLNLRPPWENVTLISGSPEAPCWPGHPRPFAYRSARPGELRWRCSRRRLRVPSGLLVLLAGEDDGEHRPFFEERRRLVSRYVGLTRGTRGYSLIGYASTFVAP
jgi:hypothetical protein